MIKDLFGPFTKSGIIAHPKWHFIGMILSYVLKYERFVNFFKPECPLDHENHELSQS